jgi:NitT/TauT family transport system substrate-binding protein
MKTHNQYWIIAALAGIAIIAFAMIGCSRSVPSNQLTQITLQLKWTYNAGFVGDLVAKDKGLWKEQGLDVQIRPGGPGITPVKVVTSGDAQFGVATGDQLLLAAEDGNPVIAVALAYNKNPLAWIVRGESKINSAADFKGKKIGLSFIDDEPLFNAMMARVGLDPKKDVQVVPVKFDTSPFLRKEVDGFPIFRNTQGIELASELRKQGVETKTIGPADEGLVSYSNLYFTTNDYLNQHPEVVKAFVAGALKAWEYAQAHPDEAATIVAKYDKDNQLDIIKQEVVSTDALIKPSPTDHIGNMTREGWSSTQDILMKSQQLKKPLELDRLFTNRYVDEYYKH